MVIPCLKCGRPACSVEIPKFERGQLATVRRFIPFEIPSLELLLDPTPQQVAEFFNVRCASGC